MSNLHILIAASLIVSLNAARIFFRHLGRELPSTKDSFLLHGEELFERSRCGELISFESDLLEIKSLASIDLDHDLAGLPSGP